jgi:integrase
MGIYQRSDSKYWWLYLETTKQRERTHILIGETITQRKDTEALAEQLYHTRMLDQATIAHGLTPRSVAGAEPDGLTFSAFLPWYRDHILPQRKGREREEEILPRLERAFGGYRLQDITRAVVIPWRTMRLSTPTVIAHFGGPKGRKRTLPPPQPRTVNREVDVLQLVLKAAVEAQQLTQHPLYGLADLPTKPPRRRIMTEAEEHALAEALGPVDWAIFLCGLDALIRLGDIFDLRRDADHGHYLEIPDPKNGTPLTVPVSRRLREALDAVSSTDVYYFPERRGAATDRDRRNGYAHALQRACVQAGLPYGRTRHGITFHWATRRTGATRMIQRGGEKAIGVVQRIGGWKDPSVLIGIYQETMNSELQAAVDSVSPISFTLRSRSKAKVLKIHEKSR